MWRVQNPQRIRSDQRYIYDTIFMKIPPFFQRCAPNCGKMSYLISSLADVIKQKSDDYRKTEIFLERQFMKWRIGNWQGSENRVVCVYAHVSMWQWWDLLCGLLLSEYSQQLLCHYSMRGFRFKKCFLNCVLKAPVCRLLLFRLPVDCFQSNLHHIRLRRITDAFVV